MAAETVKLGCALVAIAAATSLGGCGSSAPRSSDRIGRDQAQARRAALGFARCMRSRGVSNFPDDLNIRTVPDIDPSAPAFRSAQMECRHLLPVKTPPEAAPSAQTRARMLRLSNCLRAHGYPTIPDPKPDPPPTGGSPEANRYGTLYGEGDYWIGIPNSIDAHGAAFVRTARSCGATGVGP